MVLAGGEGKRLGPLTADRAKPAVTFGGHYRIVDFALSNLANAGYHELEADRVAERLGDGGHAKRVLALDVGIDDRRAARLSDGTLGLRCKLQIDRHRSIDID